MPKETHEAKHRVRLRNKQKGTERAHGSQRTFDMHKNLNINVSSSAADIWLTPSPLAERDTGKLTVSFSFAISNHYGSTPQAHILPMAVSSLKGCLSHPDIKQMSKTRPVQQVKAQGTTGRSPPHPTLKERAPSPALLRELHTRSGQKQDVCRYLLPFAWCRKRLHY